MARMSLKALVQDVQAKNAAMSALHREVGETTDSARYQEINRPGGLLRQAENAKKAARERLQKRIHSMTGVYAYMFKDLI
jgi:hypothetical protein